MSAPQQGRQSPDPERQTGAQINEPVGTDPNKQGGAPSLDHAKDESEKQKKHSLSSNPTSAIDKEAEEKTAKKGGMGITWGELNGYRADGHYE
ncbi:MAG: hypothetical protein M1820_008766 [Bogoriella megaspora]|nr:MAG: hypothetical protein M1820_008766 [Bogoriella megaspora]